MVWLDSAIQPLAGYPRWLVLLCLGIVGLALLWLATRILKWSLYVLVALLLMAGAGVVLSLFFA